MHSQIRYPHTGPSLPTGCFPTSCPTTVGTPAVFSFVSFNGRSLIDNAPKVMTTLAMNTPVAQGIGPESVTAKPATRPEATLMTVCSGLKFTVGLNASIIRIFHAASSRPLSLLCRRWTWIVVTQRAHWLTRCGDAAYTTRRGHMGATAPPGFARSMHSADIGS